MNTNFWIDNINFSKSGKSAYKLANELWPLNRSLTGNGLRKTLDIIKREIPDLKIFSVPSGFKAYDWVVPKEWMVKEAWIKTPDGEKICNFEENNLHLIGYSQPFKGNVDLSILQNHLFSLPEQIDAIPYVTSYYEEKWGFCIKHKDRLKLKPGIYQVFIDVEHFEGFMNYGELLVKGKSKKEVLLSTYVCHPSMANNELSGPVVAQEVAKIISKLTDRYFSYRFLFIPETIGSIVYISKNLKILQENLIAGFVLTCLGDEGIYSYIPSRYGDSYSDYIVKKTFQHRNKKFKSYSFLDRGSDERQFCAPKVNLPICSVTKSKYGTFSQYHTSKDDLNFISSKGLSESIEIYSHFLFFIENNYVPEVNVLCEPQLGKRGLYSLNSKSRTLSNYRDYCNVFAYSDGMNDIFSLSEQIKIPVHDIITLVEDLEKEGLITLRQFS